jgi:hypothetical protein
MPVISMFYGIIVMMYFLEAVFKIPEGGIIEGFLPNAKQKLVEAWIEIHHEELMADWELAVNGSQVFTIEPLK